MRKFYILNFIYAFSVFPLTAQLMSVESSALAANDIQFESSELKTALSQDIDGLMSKVVKWRHDLHEYPELGNREFKTSKYIADILNNNDILITRLAQGLPMGSELDFMDNGTLLESFRSRKKI